jgi:hypothetical protein
MFTLLLLPRYYLMIVTLLPPLATLMAPVDGGNAAATGPAFTHTPTVCPC